MKRIANPDPKSKDIVISAPAEQWDLLQDLIGIPEDVDTELHSEKHVVIAQFITDVVFGQTKEPSPRPFPLNEASLEYWTKCFKHIGMDFNCPGCMDMFCHGRTTTIHHCENAISPEIALQIKATESLCKQARDQLDRVAMGLRKVAENIGPGQDQESLQ